MVFTRAIIDDVVCRRTFPEAQVEDVREGDAPERIAPKQPHSSEQYHNLDRAIHEDDRPDAEFSNDAWETRNYDKDDDDAEAGRDADKQLDGLPREDNVWGRDSNDIDR